MLVVGAAVSMRNPSCGDLDSVYDEGDDVVGTGIPRAVLESVYHSDADAVGADEEEVSQPRQSHASVGFPVAAFGDHSEDPSCTLFGGKNGISDERALILGEEVGTAVFPELPAEFAGRASPPKLKAV